MRSASENTASMSCSIKRIVYCRFRLANSFDIEERRDLERSRQAEPRAASGRQLGDVAPVEHDPARIRPEPAGQLPDQRGLAGAVRTDERMGFALADAERHVVGGDERAERL